MLIRAVLLANGPPTGAASACAKEPAKDLAFWRLCWWVALFHFPLFESSRVTRGQNCFKMFIQTFHLSGCYLQ